MSEDLDRQARAAAAAAVPVFTETVDETGQVLDTKMSQFLLMPAPPGTCEQCAVAHDPRLHHDQRSLHYQYWFYGHHMRWPTWEDAMVHCDEAVKVVTRRVLREHGLIEGDADGDE